MRSQEEERSPPLPFMPADKLVASMIKAGSPEAVDVRLWPDKLNKSLSEVFVHLSPPLLSLYDIEYDRLGHP